MENINVSKNVREFFEKMQEFFPSTKNAYIESVKEYGEVLETVVIEDIFMPELLTLLAKNEDAELLSNMFNYFEEIIYVFLTIFLYLLKCPQSLILSALRAFCFCGKPHISRSIFLYFRYQAWLKSW